MCVEIKNKKRGLTKTNIATLKPREKREKTSTEEVLCLNHECAKDRKMPKHECIIHEMYRNEHKRENMATIRECQRCSPRVLNHLC